MKTNNKSTKQAVSLNLVPESVLAAGIEFVKRKDRVTHPDGSFDNGNRWYPTGKDAAALDKGIRSPSRAWPYSYLTACRSAAHVARIYGVDATEVRRMANRLRKEMDATGMDVDSAAKSFQTYPDPL